jgi:MbtH protein
MEQDVDDKRHYKVVINDELQYSIWPFDRPNPLGWHDEGVHGSKSECLQHIDVVWTDMRPLSLRKFMEASQTGSPEPPAAA